MRNGPKIKFNKEGEGNFQLSADWNDNPMEVMEAVSKELAQYGLEVVNHENNGDFFAFSIVKIKKPKVHPLTTQTLKESGVALKMFGDKGANEVMDVKALATKYKALWKDERLRGCKCKGPLKRDVNLKCPIHGVEKINW